MGVATMTRLRRLVSILLHLGLLTASGTAVLAIRHLVANENLSDQASLAVTGVTSLALAIAVAVSLRSALAEPTWRRCITCCALPIGFLVICAAFVASSLVDSSVEMAALMGTDGPASPPTSIEIGPGGRDVRFTGDFQEGVARRLADLLSTNPGIVRIHLTSDGGLADEGQAVGNVIAAHRLTTFVPDYCISACTLAFVRGRERVVLASSRLGFHAPYEEGLFGAVYKGDSSEQRDAYIAAGIEPHFVATALKINPEEVWYPTFEELLAAHVATARVDDDQLPDSTLDGTATLEGARALISRNFSLVGVFLKQSPRAIDAIAGWYLDAYRSGRSEGENTRALTTIVRSAVAAGLSRADDETLLDLARFLTDALAVADTPHACEMIGGRVDLVTATKHLVAADSDATAAADALFDRALNGHHVLTSPQQATRALAAAARSVRSQGGPEASCAQWHQKFTSLLQQSSPSIVAEMRGLVDVQALRSLAALKSVPPPLLHVAGSAASSGPR